MSCIILFGEFVYDVIDVEIFLRWIDEYWLEMDVREEGFNKVMEVGEKMIDNGYFVFDEVSYFCFFVFCWCKNIFF